MNILFVVPYVPYPPISGGRLQTFLKLKHVKIRGHAVFLQICAFMSDRPYINELAAYIDDIETIFVRPDWSKLKHFFMKSLLYEIFTYQKGMSERLRIFAMHKKVDVAVFEGLGVAQYRDSIPDIPSILYEHNVEYEVVQQHVAAIRKSPLKVVQGTMSEKLRNCYLLFGGAIEQKLVKQFELNSLKEFQVILTCSERDAMILRKDTGNVICPEMIPWGVELPVHYHRPRQKEPFCIVFVGSMTWEPNKDGITWFVTEIFPLVRRGQQKVRLIVAGSGMTREISRLRNREDIIIKGFVPDISEILLDADIFVAPIRFGGGVNVKILEAMSYGIPVVTTSKGAEGLTAVHKKDFLVADTPEEISGYIKYLLDNLEERESIGQNAREYIAGHHNIERVTDLFEQVICKVTEKQ